MSCRALLLAAAAVIGLLLWGAMSADPGTPLVQERGH